MHVVDLLRPVRYDVRQTLVHPVGVIGGRIGGRILQVVRWQEREQVPNPLEDVFVVLAHEGSHAGLSRMSHRSTQRLHRHVLARDGLDHVGAGDEHV